MGVSVLTMDAARHGMPLGPSPPLQPVSTWTYLMFIPVCIVGAIASVSVTYRIRRWLKKPKAPIWAWRQVSPGAVELQHMLVVDALEQLQPIMEPADALQAHAWAMQANKGDAPK